MHAEFQRMQFLGVNVQYAENTDVCETVKNYRFVAIMFGRQRNTSGLLEDPSSPQPLLRSEAGR